MVLPFRLQCGCLRFVLCRCLLLLTLLQKCLLPAAQLVWAPRWVPPPCCWASLVLFYRGSWCWYGFCDPRLCVRDVCLCGPGWRAFSSPLQIGRLVVTPNVLCFHCSILGYKNTKVIPLRRLSSATMTSTTLTTLILLKFVEEVKVAPSAVDVDDLLGVGAAAREPAMATLVAGELELSVTQAEAEGLVELARLFRQRLLFPESNYFVGDADAEATSAAAVHLDDVLCKCGEAGRARSHTFLKREQPQGALYLLPASRLLLCRACLCSDVRPGVCMCACVGACCSGRDPAAAARPPRQRGPVVARRCRRCGGPVCRRQWPSSCVLLGGWCGGRSHLWTRHRV
jgi:hypothetical protein